jgi:Domain of unknown function (DUF4258)
MSGWREFDEPSKVVLVDDLLGKSQVEFIYHALDQMRIRRISEAQVLAVIRHPTETGLPTQERRERVRKLKTPTRAIDVVYELLEDRIRVITVFPKRLRRR